MSSVRMCDRCGVVFSERADGWGSASMTTMRTDERTGQPRPVQESIDLCPSCNRPAHGPVQLAPVPAADAADRLADIHHGKVPDATLNG